jgi:putative Mg2+ transporter-C (MgtC) family protein
MFSPEIIDYLIKILLSIILGGLIGMERELTHHWAGLRTHVLVCLGSTLFMFMTSFQYLNPQTGVTFNLDATRLAAGVITGIGFLGAGVIFREGASVKGLTTAASIWVTASVGVLVGIAKYELAIIATVLIMVVLYSDMFLERYVFKEQRNWLLNLTINDKPAVQSKIERMISFKNVKFQLKDFSRSDESVSLVYIVTLPKDYPKEKLTRTLLKDVEVSGVAWKK